MIYVFDSPWISESGWKISVRSGKKSWIIKQPIVQVRVRVRVTPLGWYTYPQRPCSFKKCVVMTKKRPWNFNGIFSR